MRRTLSVVLAALTLAAGSLAARAADWKIDPVHSVVIYKIKHFDVSWQYGTFHPTGEIAFDPAAPEKATYSLTIKPGELDSGVKQRDDHLKSPDFFNVKQYPEIIFKSSSVKKTGDNTFELTGDLTLHGTTKTITIPLTFVNAAKTPFGDTRAGFEATIDLKRTDYGINGLVGPVGDDVHLITSLEAIQQ